jgi:hypothetical protein
MGDRCIGGLRHIDGVVENVSRSSAAAGRIGRRRSRRKHNRIGEGRRRIRGGRVHAAARRVSAVRSAAGRAVQVGKTNTAAAANSEVLLFLFLDTRRCGGRPPRPSAADNCWGGGGKGGGSGAPHAGIPAAAAAGRGIVGLVVEEAGALQVILQLTLQVARVICTINEGLINGWNKKPNRGLQRDVVYLG